MNYFKIFEAYVLRIISVTFLIISLIYLFKQQWLTGFSIFLISTLIIGGIGQSLKHNKEKSLSKLLEGQEFDFNNISGEDQQMTQEQSRLITKPFMLTSYTVMILSSIILLHHDYKFYIAIPLSFLIGVLFPLLLFLFGIFVTKNIAKK